MVRLWNAGVIIRSSDKLRNGQGLIVIVVKCRPPRDIISQLRTFWSFRILATTKIVISHLKSLFQFSNLA